MPPDDFDTPWYKDLGLWLLLALGAMFVTAIVVSLFVAGA